MTDSAVPFLTVKVTTPLASETPLGAEIVELPLPAVRETALPLTRLLLASFKVTVIFEVVELSAGTEVGLAATVDVPALTAPGFTVNELLLPNGGDPPAPLWVAVIVKLPVFVIVTLTGSRTPAENDADGFVNTNVPVEVRLTLLLAPLKLVTVLLLLSRAVILMLNAVPAVCVPIGPPPDCSTEK